MSSNGPGMQMHWIYFLSKLLASLTTIFLFVVIFAISGSVLFWDSPELSVFVTNTFYTSNDNEHNLSWPVLTQTSWNGLPRNPATFYNDIKFEYYYECLWVSQIGWNLCNGSSATVATYQQCLNTNYATQLSTCTSTSSSSNWPTANVYANCVNNGLGGARWNLNAFKSCIRTELWPLYEVPQDVDSINFLGSFSWPLIMLTGAFLFGVFAMYTIYPVDWEDTTIIEHGKPKSVYTRLGVAWTVLPIMLLIFWFIVVTLVAFRASPTWPNQNTHLYPSTQQTNVVIVTATLAVLFYFFLEASEFYEKYMFEHGAEHEKSKASADVVIVKSDIPYPVKMAPQGSNIFTFPPPNQQRGRLGYYFPGIGQTLSVSSLRDAGEIYTPVLLNTWADAYLVDPLFFVGALGATMQLTTASVYNVFWCLVYYRLAHVGVARLIYHSYVRIPGGDEDINAAKESNAVKETTAGQIPENVQAAQESLAATRVLALSMHVAGALALVVVFYILFDSSKILSEFPTTQNLFIIGLLVPEAIRLAGHLTLAVMQVHRVKGYGKYILMFAQLLWTWDLVIRVIFLWVYFWGSDTGRGTKPFLFDRFASINTMMQFTG